jgi:hypothetical protein
MFSFSLIFRSLSVLSKVFLIFEVFKPIAEMFAKESRTILILQHFLPAPVRHFLAYNLLCLFCCFLSYLFQSDESKWPELQRTQFKSVNDHAAFIEPWIPDVRPLSNSIYDISAVTQHLSSAPLWIEDWSSLSAMSDAECIIVSFREQQLRHSQFPWTQPLRIEQDEDIEAAAQP